MFIENINQFVIDFLESNKTNMTEQWSSKKNQQLLIKTLKKNNIKIKDPDKPKRGKSGFLFYCDNKRPIIKQENPELTVKEIVSKLGTEWQILKASNSTEISKYEEMSSKDRNRYKQEMKNYIPILNRKTDFKKKSGKKPSKRRSKRNEEDIMFENFTKMKKQRVKKSHPEFDSKDVTEYIKSKWENLTEEKKLKYKNKKKKDV
jgi:ribonuclease BN (tRNA processing enzyme)